MFVVILPVCQAKYFDPILAGFNKPLKLGFGCFHLFITLLLRTGNQVLQFIRLRTRQYDVDAFRVTSQFT